MAASKLVFSVKTPWWSKYLLMPVVFAIAQTMLLMGADLDQIRHAIYKIFIKTIKIEGVRKP